MTAQIYGEALYRAITGGMTAPKALARLKDILREHGRDTLYGAALRDAYARFMKEEERGVVKVVLASKKDEKKFSKEIKNFLEEVDAHGAEVIVDEHIIGGFVLRSREHELDQSYKKSLLTVYQSLIT